MHLISASRRTDIPAFHTTWLLNRLNAGFCHWINPFGGQVYRVSLRPEDVLAIVLWTRNPAPLLPHLAGLQTRGYHVYAHMTITGYARPLETHSPPLDAAVDAFRRLASALLPGMALWRYDPIVISERTPAVYHAERFATLCRLLQGHTPRCTISFMDDYGKTARNLKQNGIVVQQPDGRAQRELVATLQQIASRNGIAVHTCCEPALDVPGVQQAHCVDLDLVRALRGDGTLAVKRAPSRAGCGCAAAADIGAYDTCAFGCTYCYATNSRDAALERIRQCDPTDSVLWRPPALRGVDLSTRETVLR